mgnify:CR=1 FL=1
MMFRLLNTFDLVVPKSYNHATQLDSFRREHPENLSYYDRLITDENFGRATTKLAPGQRFEVEIFQIMEIVTSNDCMRFLRAKKAILTGAQGASLVWQEKKEELPLDKWHASFDEKEALLVTNGSHRLPFIRHYSDGSREFVLGCFERDWGGSSCLLCFHN